MWGSKSLNSKATKKVDREQAQLAAEIERLESSIEKSREKQRQLEKAIKSSSIEETDLRASLYQANLEFEVLEEQVQQSRWKLKVFLALLLPVALVVYTRV